MAESRGAAGSAEGVTDSFTAVGSSAERTATAGYSVERTAPDKVLRHDISDEELGILGDMRRDHTWEGMWAAVALATGAAPTAITALVGAYFSSKPTPMTIIDLIQVVFMSVGVVLALVLFLITKSRGKAASDLVKEIRKRKSQHVNG